MHSGAGCRLLAVSTVHAQLMEKRARVAAGICVLSVPTECNGVCVLLCCPRSATVCDGCFIVAQGVQPCLF